MRWDSRKTDTPWKSWSTFPRHVIQTTINTKTNSEHTLSHLLSTQKNANTEGQNVVASTSKVWYSSHQAAFSIRRTLNPWWGWRADLSVPVPLNEAEGKTYPPRAAYHNLPSMQLTQLSKRNKGLVCPSSTRVQAHRRQSRPCASSGHPNTPRAHQSERWWRQKFPISTMTTAQNFGFYFILLYLHRDSGGTSWAAQHKCVSSFYCLCLHGSQKSTQNERLVEEARRGGFSRAEQGIFQEGIRGALHALLLKEQRGLLLNHL